MKQVGAFIYSQLQSPVDIVDNISLEDFSLGFGVGEPHLCPVWTYVAAPGYRQELGGSRGTHRKHHFPHRQAGASFFLMAG